MKVVIDRDLCDASLPFCQRCSAALIRYPQGVDRPCIMDVVEDGKETLTIKMFTDGRELEIELTDEQREVGSIEGWEALADFDHCIAVEPHLAAPYFNRASTYEALGQNENAIADFKRFIELSDNEEWKKTAQQLLDKLEAGNSNNKNSSG